MKLLEEEKKKVAALLAAREEAIKRQQQQKQPLLTTAPSEQQPTLPSPTEKSKQSEQPIPAEEELSESDVPEVEIISSSATKEGAEETKEDEGSGAEIEKEAEGEEESGEDEESTEELAIEEGKPSPEVETAVVTPPPSAPSAAAEPLPVEEIKQPTPTLPTTDVTPLTSFVDLPQEQRNRYMEELDLTNTTRQRLWTNIKTHYGEIKKRLVELFKTIQLSRIGNFNPSILFSEATDESKRASERYSNLLDRALEPTKEASVTVGDFEKELSTIKTDQARMQEIEHDLAKEALSLAPVTLGGDPSQIRKDLIERMTEVGFDEAHADFSLLLTILERSNPSFSKNGQVGAIREDFTELNVQFLKPIWRETKNLIKRPVPFEYDPTKFRALVEASNRRFGNLISELSGMFEDFALKALSWNAKEIGKFRADFITRSGRFKTIERDENYYAALFEFVEFDTQPGRPPLSLTRERKLVYKLSNRQITPNEEEVVLHSLIDKGSLVIVVDNDYVSNTSKDSTLDRASYLREYAKFVLGAILQLDNLRDQAVNTSPTPRAFIHPMGLKPFTIDFNFKQELEALFGTNLTFAEEYAKWCISVLDQQSKYFADIIRITRKNDEKQMMFDVLNLVEPVGSEAWTNVMLKLNVGIRIVNFVTFAQFAGSVLDEEFTMRETAPHYPLDRSTQAQTNKQLKFKQDKAYETTFLELYSHNIDVSKWEYPKGFPVYDRANAILRNLKNHGEIGPRGKAPSAAATIAREKRPTEHPLATKSGETLPVITQADLEMPSDFFEPRQTIPSPPLSPPSSPSPTPPRAVSPSTLLESGRRPKRQLIAESSSSSDNESSTESLPVGEERRTREAKSTTTPKYFNEFDSEAEEGGSQRVSPSSSSVSSPLSTPPPELDENEASALEELLDDPNLSSIDRQFILHNQWMYKPDFELQKLKHKLRQQNLDSVDEEKQHVEVSRLDQPGMTYSKRRVLQSNPWILYPDADFQHAKRQQAQRNLEAAEDFPGDLPEPTKEQCVLQSIQSLTPMKRPKTTSSSSNSSSSSSSPLFSSDDEAELPEPMPIMDTNGKSLPLAKLSYNPDNVNAYLSEETPITHGGRYGSTNAFKVTAHHL